MLCGTCINLGLLPAFQKTSSSLHPQSSSNHSTSHTKLRSRKDLLSPPHTVEPNGNAISATATAKEFDNVPSETTSEAADEKARCSACVLNGL
jgi:hypothetical protein